MANWNNPTVNSLYTDFVDEVKNRDLDVAKMMDSATVTVTNPTSGMKRWNDSNSNWEEWNGSSWVALTTTYGISISGTAGAVAFANITGKPTTLSGYGITDAQGLDSDLTAVAGLSTTGLIVRTGSGTATTRSLAAPAAGFTITNSDGVSGNPTFVLANDLAALEALATTGLVRRTATSTWSAGTTVATAEIADDAVTYAKIQNVTATDRVLGRSTSGAGNVEEIICTAFARSLLATADAAAHRALATPFAAGTNMLFQQTSAPTGWTKDTTHNDKALRVVTGTASSGGATAFTTVFGSGKTTGSTVLTTAHLPASGLSIPGLSIPSLSVSASGSCSIAGMWGGGVTVPGGGPSSHLSFAEGGNANSLGGSASVTGSTGGGTTGTGTTGNMGSGGGHTHTESLDLQYVDVIVATKD
jgi:hypothetical protein